jgi:transposase InsO family protein
LLSDLGQNFVGEVMTEAYKLLKVKRVMTSSFHPQANGLIERFHHTLSQNLALYVNDRHDDWDDYLSAVCYAYNTAVNLDSTCYSPFFLMFGREPFSPLDTVLPNVSDLTDYENLPRLEKLLLQICCLHRTK